MNARLTALFICLLYSNIALHAQTIVEKTNEGWSLLVDGRPFAIKGVTFGYDKKVDNYDLYFQDLKSLGVNTIRTWGTGPHTAQLLDAAHAHDIKVMVGIWMRHGRPGMEADDSFDYLGDQEGKKKMFEEAMATVRLYGNHPAVLTWGVGNEVYLNMETDEEKEVYSLLLEELCSSIKKLDPHHPIASVAAWTFGMDWWDRYVPSIDIYGINAYGAAAGLIAKEMSQRGIDKPYMITEFGVRGEWDATQDDNGVTIEPDDEEKYEAIVKGYREWIVPEPSCLGLFVFHYADDHRFLAPWLLTHYRGMTRPTYWAIREAYTGTLPENYPPAIRAFGLPDGTHESGTWVPVTLDITDQENEPLDVHFAYNQRTGSRARRDQLVPLAHRGNLTEGFDIQMPAEHGAIKVYACVRDRYPNVGIATTSIVVADEAARQRKYLVPRVDLPFYVYREGIDEPYVSSGHMGNYEAMTIDLRQSDEVYEGEAALLIRYDARAGWYGIGFVDPPGDWGSRLGGYNLTGARTFSFWAKADDNVKAKAGFGLIEKDQPYPDTAKQLIEIALTTTWQKFTIKTRKLDLSCIRSGFVLFSSSHGFAHNIYVDNVVFE